MKVKKVSYYKGMHVIEFTFCIGNTCYNTQKHVYIPENITDTRTAYEIMDEELKDFRTNGMSVSKAVLKRWS